MEVALYQGLKNAAGRLDACTCSLPGRQAVFKEGY